MHIWRKETPCLEQLNSMAAGTLAAVLGMEFTAIGEDYLVAKMPVDHRTRQPFGILHGGASAALAETVGSMAGWLCINPELKSCVGLELNCNHIRSKTDGWIFARAQPVHIGGSTQVWDIRITDEKEQLICISRLTMAVIKKLQRPSA